MADQASKPDAIFAQMTASSVTGPPPPPARRAVSGFPTHTHAVASLPPIEQIDLRMMVEWVIDTHEFAGFPVRKITCIGHADRDVQRGKDFEQQISERRAEAVKTFFANEISRLSFSVFDAMQPGFVPVLQRIAFESSGVGSSEHVPAQNEAGRRRNRRVTIIFERDRTLQRLPPFIVDITKLPLPPDPNPPPPRPSWTKPIPPPIKLPRSALEEKLDQIRKSPLRFLDMGSITKASFNALREFIEPTRPGPEREKAEEELAKELRDIWEEEKRKRDNRTKNPPGDPAPD
ncbi:MAG TPA: hypothetical protein DCQ84_10720 [Candidatus Competibacteraceae bacterium]|nr:hypothetical protein [Candidatus Competibacteraceae bacterium]